MADVKYWAQARGGQYQLQVYIPSVDSTQYDYGLQSIGTGQFDIWTTSVFGTSDIIQENLPEISTEPLMASYTYPDNNQHIVSSWACSEKVITVANYVNRTEYIDYNGQLQQLGFDVGNIFSSSSAGPSRTGLQKPDIAATGSIALSAGDFDILASLIALSPNKVAQGGMHHRNGGTSMASPVVSGVAALFLEQCPESTWSDFKAAIISGAASDLPTGSTPNTIWGYGKLNAFSTVSAQSIVADIELSGDNLLSSPGESYQWYIDGLPIGGQVFQSLVMTSSGSYQVEVFNENGCSKISEPFLFTSVDELDDESLEVYPNPSSGLLSIRGLKKDDLIEIQNSNGEKVYLGQVFTSQTLDVDLSELARGVYTLLLTREEGALVEKIIID